MRSRFRTSMLALVSLAVVGTALITGAGTSNATTVRPNWNQTICPANAWAPGDIYCYQASDPLSWVRFHVYYDSGTQHDKAWANGYVGQSNLHGNVCVVDSLTGKSNCASEKGGTGRGVQTGAIPDGPANFDFGELDLYDAANNLVSIYRTQGF